MWWQSGTTILRNHPARIRLTGCASRNNGITRFATLLREHTAKG